MEIPLSSSSFSYLLSFLLVFLIFLYKWYSVAHKPFRNPPPSPRKLPIIGNLHQLGQNPHRSLHALAKKYGTLMLLHLGSVPVIVASSSEAARELLKTHDLIFSNRPNATISRKISYNHKDIGFAPYGEYWRKLKSMVVLELLSNKRVQSFRRVREEEMALMIEKIRDKITCSSFNLSDLFLSITNDVICRVALGRKYYRGNLKGILIEQMYLLGIFRAGDYIPWLSWLDGVTGLNDRVEKYVKETDEFLEGIIEEHLMQQKRREASGGRSNEGEKQDFVDILLQAQRENLMGISFDRDTIKAIIMDVFAAGSDNGFTVQDWTMAELLRHPKVMEKLKNEVRETVPDGSTLITEDYLHKFPYLKAVIKESLRLHSTVPLLVPRESTQEAKIMGYDISAGTKVYINAWAIGRDPSVWEDPEVFMPERFLNSSIDYYGNHLEFIPFGSGRRVCPGIKFATTIIELVLANLVHKFDFALPDGAKGEDLDMTETFGISVRRKSPLIVVAIPY